MKRLKETSIHGYVFLAKEKPSQKPREIQRIRIREVKVLSNLVQKCTMGCRARAPTPAKARPPFELFCKQTDKHTPSVV